MLDSRRKTRFDKASAVLKQECENLGLFKARSPQFFQPSPHGFGGSGATMTAEQPYMNEATQHGAETHLLSGTRLESNCGVSDFSDPHAASSQVPLENSDFLTLNRYLLPNPYHVTTMSDALCWREWHGALRSPVLTLEHAMNTVQGEGPFDFGIVGGLGSVEGNERRFEDLPMPIPFNLHPAEIHECAAYVSHVETSAFLPVSGRENHTLWNNPSLFHDGKAKMEEIEAGQPDERRVSNVAEIGALNLGYKTDRG